jgi:TATA-binding protein-associated factor Taf7
VDPFAAIIFGGIAVIVLSVYLIGRYYPGSGLEQVGLRSAREIIETREALEAEDLDQMLAAHNARRRARGEGEVTAEEMELSVAAQQRDQERRREEYLADRELDQLLDATNRRRRARGLPERTREQVREEFGPGSGSDG